MEPFGSFVSNLFTRWGDLDISIELPYGSYVSSAGKKRKQSLLAELLKALRQKGDLCNFHDFMFLLKHKMGGKKGFPWGVDGCTLLFFMFDCLLQIVSFNYQDNINLQEDGRGCNLFPMQEFPF